MLNEDRGCPFRRTAKLSTEEIATVAQVDLFQNSTSTFSWDNNDCGSNGKDLVKL